MSKAPRRGIHSLVLNPWKRKYSEMRSSNVLWEKLARAMLRHPRWKYKCCEQCTQYVNARHWCSYLLNDNLSFFAAVAKYYFYWWMATNNPINVCLSEAIELKEYTLDTMQCTIYRLRRVRNEITKTLKSITEWFLIWCDVWIQTAKSSRQHRNKSNVVHTNSRLLSQTVGMQG